MFSWLVGQSQDCSTTWTWKQCSVYLNVKIFVPKINNHDLNIDKNIQYHHFCRHCAAQLYSVYVLKFCSLLLCGINTDYLLLLVRKVHPKQKNKFYLWQNIYDPRSVFHYYKLQFTFSVNFYFPLKRRLVTDFFRLRLLKMKKCVILTGLIKSEFTFSKRFFNN